MYIFGWSLLLNFLFILHCNIYIYGVNQKFYEEQHKNSIDLRTKFFKLYINYQSVNIQQH